MIQILIRIILSVPALIADILHLIVISLLQILLVQDRGMLIKVTEGYRHNHFPTLNCLWKKPYFNK